MESTLKLKKVNNRNLTNDRVRCYDAHYNAFEGGLFPKFDKTECWSNGTLMCDDVLYYIKLSDIDKEARKQIKAMKKEAENGK